MTSVIVGLSIFLSGFAAAATQGESVFLDELTSPELARRIASGSTTALVPIGGTEQNGPHMVLGKHNVRVHVLAGRIAAGLGNAVVAPVVAYVPEGSVKPPQGHMRYAGTISISDASFEAMLEGIARSLKQHGFREIVFLGDHGGYQRDLEHVASRLTQEWRLDPACRVHALRTYYDAAQAPFAAVLREHGHGAGEIGVHAGLADTSLALAVDPRLVRMEHLLATLPDRDGVVGDPRQATAELGQIGAQAIVQASIAAIRKLQQR
ncbi:MAG: creatininase family protein [Pseudomonadota bacterium]|nr:creatininase family protein [Pseudomonadota bacterium]